MWKKWNDKDSNIWFSFWKQENKEKKKHQYNFLPRKIEKFSIFVHEELRQC